MCVEIRVYKYCAQHKTFLLPPPRPSLSEITNFTRRIVVLFLKLYTSSSFSLSSKLTRNNFTTVFCIPLGIVNFYFCVPLNTAITTTSITIHRRTLIFHCLFSCKCLIPYHLKIILTTQERINKIINIIACNSVVRIIFK